MSSAPPGQSAPQKQIERFAKDPSMQSSAVILNGVRGEEATMEDLRRLALLRPLSARGSHKTAPVY